MTTAVLRRKPRKAPVSGKTAEQADAFAQLRAVASMDRLRVQPDGEGFPMIPGKYGQIEWHDPEGRELAVYCDHPRFFEKLWAIPGLRRHQTGDQEMRAVFPLEALEQVAGVIRAKRKPGITSEMARNMGSGTAFRGTSRT